MRERNNLLCNIIVFIHLQCLFISMFWITMRQYMAERKRQRRSSTLRDMVAPLHVSVSTATTAMSHDAPEIKSEFMKDVGKLLKNLLTKFWIAVVAIMLFTSGITGERMTVFRIVYMSLFLVFVITFQVCCTRLIDRRSKSRNLSTEMCHLSNESRNFRCRG